MADETRRSLHREDVEATQFVQLDQLSLESISNELRSKPPGRRFLLGIALGLLLGLAVLAAIIILAHHNAHVLPVPAMPAGHS